MGLLKHRHTHPVVLFRLLLAYFSDYSMFVFCFFAGDVRTVTTEDGVCLCVHTCECASV